MIAIGRTISFFTFAGYLKCTCTAFYKHTHTVMHLKFSEVLIMVFNKKFYKISMEYQTTQNFMLIRNSLKWAQY
jgi:hypothetical protein